jgi:RNA polymerase sigma-70 factor (ECF subfamily)
MHCEQGQREFFETAAMALMKRLYGAAMRLTRNAADAEDLVADALAKAWARFDELRDRDKFDGWLLRVLSNTYVSNWRHRRAELEMTDPLEAGDCEPAENSYLYTKLHQPFLLWWSTPEQTFVNDLLHEELQSALDSLPDVYRIVVVLVEVLGHSYDEVAGSLEVPVGTVRSRLNRGRKLLQQTLWSQAQQKGLRGADAPLEK